MPNYSQATEYLARCNPASEYKKRQHDSLGQATSLPNQRRKSHMVTAPASPARHSSPTWAATGHCETNPSYQRIHHYPGTESAHWPVHDYAGHVYQEQPMGPPPAAFPTYHSQPSNELQHHSGMASNQSLPLVSVTRNQCRDGCLGPRGIQPISYIVCL